MTEGLWTRKYFGIMYAKTPAPRQAMNTLLKKVYSIGENSSVYCSKSYADDIIAVAIGAFPIACDIENFAYFNDNLPQKLRFFTDDNISSLILNSHNPEYMATKLWTRKECIYKYYNVRNGFSSCSIYNNDDILHVDGNIIYTYQVSKTALLSFLYPEEHKNIKIYEMIGNNLLEKI